MKARQPGRWLNSTVTQRPSPPVVTPLMTTITILEWLTGTVKSTAALTALNGHTLSWRRGRGPAEAGLRGGAVAEGGSGGSLVPPVSAPSDEPAVTRHPPFG